MKKLLFLALTTIIILLNATSLSSCDIIDQFTGANGGIQYELNDDGESYKVVGIGDCTDTDIVIPSLYSELPVTSIGDSAFAGCRGLTSITIPDSVTSIGNHAFDMCNSITSIDIPDSVTSIGDRAFHWCSALTSIDISDSVTSIGDGAFSRCYDLTNITIPDGVTSIGNSMFFECSDLTGIVIPDSVTSIGIDAFLDCTSLTDVYYTGTEEEWSNIVIGSYDNAQLNKTATIHYNYTPGE